MRKMISLIISAVLLTAILAGCSNRTAEIDSGAPDKISVIATIFAPYDFARQIIGDKAEIRMLLPPGSESHSYEPTPQDRIAIESCDVFIYVGGESDAWVTDVLEAVDTANMKIVTLMDCVEAVEEEIVEGMEDDEHDHADEDEHTDEHDHADEEPAALDEHVWTSPRNAKLIVEKISNAIAEKDSANAEIYRQNTAAYLSKLDELDAAFQEVVDNAVRKTIVMGDRFPFRYLADAYGLTYFAAFPGCSTDSEPSAATVAFLEDKIKAEGIPVVFHIELSNMNMATQIAEDTGAKVLLLHACHNITKDDFQNGATYLELMNNNVSALKEALS